MSSVVKTVRGGHLVYVDAVGRLRVELCSSDRTDADALTAFIDSVRLIKFVWIDKLVHYYVIMNGSTLTHSMDYDNVVIKPNSVPRVLNNLIDRKTFWRTGLSSSLEAISDSLLFEFPTCTSRVIQSSTRGTPLFYTGVPKDIARVFMTPELRLVTLTKSGTLRIMHEHDNTRNPYAEFFLTTSVGIVVLMTTVVVVRLLAFLTWLVVLPIVLGVRLPLVPNQRILEIVYAGLSVTWADVLMPASESKKGLVRQAYINRIIHGTIRERIVPLDHCRGTIAVLTESSTVYVIDETGVGVVECVRPSRLWITDGRLVLECGDRVLVYAVEGTRTRLLDVLELRVFGRTEDAPSAV